MNVRLAISVLALLFSLVLNGQDYRPGQYWVYYVRYNPALMYANNNINVVIGHRVQWVVIGGGYKSYTVQALVPVFRDRVSKMDFGINGVQDVAGAYVVRDARAMLAFSRSISDRLGVSVSFMGGYVSRMFDSEGLLWEDQYVDGVASFKNQTIEGDISSKAGYPRVGAGLLFWAESRDGFSGYIGISVDNLNEPNTAHLTESVSFRGIRYTGVLFVKMSLGVDGSYVGGGFYKWHEGGVWEEGYGFQIRYNEIEEGDVHIFGALWYRTNRSMVLGIGGGYRWIDIYYSYELPFGHLASRFPTVNTHEISVSFNFRRFDRSEEPPLF